MRKAGVIHGRGDPMLDHISRAFCMFPIFGLVGNTAVEAPVRFGDVQTEGPFAWFRHEHRFESIGDSTRMHDHWEHRSPFGPLGRLVDALVLGRYMRSLLVMRNDALKREAEDGVGDA